MKSDEPAVFINPFIVSDDRRDQFRKLYERFMAKPADSPRFRGGALHAAVTPARAEFAFIDFNHRASERAFTEAVAEAETVATMVELADEVQRDGALYRVASDVVAQGSGIDLITRYFAAAHERESELLALVAEDAVIAIPTSLPYGGEHRSHTGFRQTLAGFAGAWRDVATHDLKLIGGDTEVVALSRITARATNSATAFQTGVAETFRIRDSLVVEVRPFYLPPRQCSSRSTLEETKDDKVT